ncbi:FkbM family methyltransferase, partial [uncultured Helicobacter sp.]|uniref:FkbM family methyltransferase n=1 Tax=uncultured Helicobacter sp. TaxID=175537 RepID=UPI00374FC342
MLDSQTQEKIQKLCENLDNKSKVIVQTLLNRCKEAYTQGKEIYTDITLEESQELEQIGQRFYGSIEQLSYKPYRYGHYLLPTNFFEISVLWHEHSLDELESSTLAKMKHKDIIDVGACVGDSALVFQKYTDKHIYAFEPTNENYTFLLQTIQLNNATRIIPINKALGANASKGQISVYGGSSSLIFDNHTTSHDVEIITLDSFVRERNIQVGFIKVDIEGFEQEFLKGAKQTITEQKPAMLISIYHQASDFFEIKPMIESWNLGY